MSTDRTGNRDELEGDATELYERAPCGFLSTRPDGTIVRINQTLLDWLDLTRERVVGQLRFQELLTVGARIYYETHYAPLLQMQGMVNEIALELRRADHGSRHVVASATLVRDAQGQPTVQRVALFDSTDRRRYEHELLLARKRAERDAADLSAADRRKNDFIAMLAHELRNPLAPLRSAAEILRYADTRTDIVMRTTTMMQRQVSQLMRLVDDLLDVSRIGQDKLSLHRVPVDLASIIHHAVEMSSPLLDDAGLSFSMTLPDRPIYVEADAARLAQTVGNILNNAAKFTPHGGAVTLALGSAGGEACIRVRDTGIGIEEAQLSRVFDLFMQAESPLGGAGGLGIGLSLAKSLIERHGGRISVTSEGRGKGAEFVVCLPLLQEPLASVAHPFAHTPAPGTASVPQRILVVDDNDDAAQMLALLLGLLGHDIRVAHDGLEAVAACAEFSPHVVLLDIGLPKLNGYEAAQRIRAQPGRQPLLVALTGWGQEEDRRKAAVAGFDAHLVKPVEHDVLIKLLASVPADAPGPQEA